MAKCKIDKVLESTAKHYHEAPEASEFVAGLAPGEREVYLMAEMHATDGAVRTFTSAMQEVICPGCRSKATCPAKYPEGTLEGVSYARARRY